MRRRGGSQNTRPGLSTKQILSIVRDVARGLRELHRYWNYSSRDLKPSNVLLLRTNYVNRCGGCAGIEEDDSFPTVLIGDLGESQLAGGPVRNRVYRNLGIYRTRSYHYRGLYHPGTQEKVHRVHICLRYVFAGHALLLYYIL